VTPKAGSQSNPVYAAMVESMDEAVGRVLKKLDDLKLSDNTLVIFTSDNGGLATTEGGPTGATFNAPLREGKGFLYEGGVRVACIMKWPARIKAGTTSDQVACSIDLFPTIIEASRGVPLTVPAFDGISLSPVFDGERLKERAIFWHYPHYANQGSRPGGAVREGNLVLVDYYDADAPELYDVSVDALEKRNLAAEQPERVRQMRVALQNWRREINAQTNAPNPNFNPDRYRELYQDVDASRFAPAQADDAEWNRMQQWRKRMNAAAK
jgi:arylsulfatase A-like enzyme